MFNNVTYCVCWQYKMKMKASKKLLKSRRRNAKENWSITLRLPRSNCHSFRWLLNDQVELCSGVDSRVGFRRKLKRRRLPPADDGWRRNEDSLRCMFNEDFFLCLFSCSKVSFFRQKIFFCSMMNILNDDDGQTVWVSFGSDFKKMRSMQRNV